MAIFRFFYYGSRRHFGFLKLKLLTVGTVQNVALHHVKFHRNRLKHGQDMAIFRDGGCRHPTVGTV